MKEEHKFGFTFEEIYGDRKIGRFNLLEQNECTLVDCKCGWNIHIGGENREDFQKIKDFLENI